MNPLGFKLGHPPSHITPFPVTHIFINTQKYGTLRVPIMMGVVMFGEAMFVVAILDIGNVLL